MSTDIAESLAQEIVDGSYTPGEFVDCQPALPLDKNPHTVRFQQFILFNTPRLDIRSPADPAYLILQQYQPTEAGRKPIRDKLIQPLTAALHSRLGGRPTRANLTAILEPLHRAGFPVGQALMADIKDLPGALEAVLTSVLLPDPYQPFQTPYPHFALCATYEQVWEPRGYTRGELISSISLAPGEQLTLDIHSWDKSTLKSEEELATESELRVSENLTQRDVYSVTRELSKQMGGNLTASATVPIHGVPVSLGGGVSGSIAENTKTTSDKIRERTVQASHVLKNTRKLRIEVSREVGREQRQTRVVANTNRCHTLNCYYFEIMANYLVTTHRVSLEACLLLPMPKMSVTSAWVLWHEDVLKQALLDKVFLEGFDGARVLETSVEFEEITKELASVDLKPYVDAILLSYDTLLGSVEAFKQQAGEQLPNAGGSVAGPQGQATAISVQLTQDQLHQVMYMAMLATDILAWNALKKLKQDIQPSSPPWPPPPAALPPPRPAVDGLKDFLAVVGPNSYRPHWNATLTTGLSVLGISPGAFFPLLSWSFLLMQPNDAELFVAVKAADKKLKAIAKAAEDQPAPEPEGFAVMDLAKARVAFDALKSHIEDNWVYYLQALWRQEDAGQRFLRLQGYGSVAAIIENNMIGFLGHKAAFLLTNEEAVQPQIDFQAVIDNTPAEEPPVPELITVPTLGTLLEAMVGQCDACEDFIQQSRAIDLRVQEARAKEEESEADRYQRRVADGDYSDPKALSGGKVLVTVVGDQPAPPG